MNNRLEAERDRDAKEHTQEYNKLQVSVKIRWWYNIVKLETKPLLYISYYTHRN